MSTLTRVLFIGDDWYGSNATSLRNAIIRTGHECLTINTAGLRRTSIPRRAMKSTDPSREQINRWNRGVASLVATWRPDVVMAFKALWLQADTISSCSGPRWVHYHPDDSRNPENISTWYVEAEPHYDLHVTTKSFNVAELRDSGVSSVLFVPCAYDRDWHKPAAMPPSTKIGFVGNRRPDRRELIEHVARRFGRDFELCGEKWGRSPRLRRETVIRGGQYGFDLSRAVARAPVQLGLLNSANRDLHTCRSYEVPAAGGALVAERTDEHMSMLEEGKEAFFFDTAAELMDLLARLRSDAGQVSRVGAAARRRMESGSNSYEDRWATILGAL